MEDTGKCEGEDVSSFTFAFFRFKLWEPQTTTAFVIFVLLAQSMPHADDTARRLSQTGTSLYAVLELKKGAQPEEIKRAYRFRLSPSFNPGISPPNPLTVIGPSFFKP